MKLEHPLPPEVHEESSAEPGGALARMPESERVEEAAKELPSPGPSRYALGRMKLIMLSSAREQPEAALLNAEFAFEQGPVGSVVIHTCMSGNNRQSAHGWLFQSPSPDLQHDRPLAELAITSSGDAAVSAGCPADYDAVRVRVLPAPVEAPWYARPPSLNRMIVIALAAALIVPWTALLTLTDRAPRAEQPRSTVPSSDPWKTLTPVELPVPIVLPTPLLAAEGQADGAVVTPHTTSAPLRPSHATKRPRADRRQARVALPAADPDPVQGASTTEAPILEPPRIVFVERLAVRETGPERLAREQDQCKDRMLLGRAFCNEAARWSHCHPDKWDKVPECMVQAGGPMQ